VPGIREPFFTETPQIGIVVRDLAPTTQKYVDDFGIGPSDIYKFDAGNAEGRCLLLLPAEGAGQRCVREVLDGPEPSRRTSDLCWTRLREVVFPQCSSADVSAGAREYCAQRACCGAGRTDAPASAS
jgi:hypothetical protein